MKDMREAAPFTNPKGPPTMKTMPKLILAAVAAFSLCLGARALEQDTDGYYLIGSVQDWRDFAALVETDPTANAKMTADIDLGDDQTHVGGIYEKNANSYTYKGIFDGQGHTLTVAYVGGASQILAPFTKVEGGSVKNLHVAGRINTVFAYCGVVGWIQDGCISNVWMSADIFSTQKGWVNSSAIAGAAAGNNNLLIDCLFSGSVVYSESTYAGCFLGSTYSGNANIVNCLSVGTFYNAGACNGNHSNSYVKQLPSAIPAGMQATDKQLADGTIATALQAGREETVWVQGDDGPMLAIFVREKETITWLNDDGTEIDTTEVVNGAMPTHADPTKAATAPYRYVFIGWTPELEAAVSNTTYTATFRKIADLALVESDWTAADGDVISGETTHKVTIPGGATVTINGVAVAGGGGAAVDAPSFSESGESAVTKFEGAGDTWTLTAFAEMEGDSVGTAVTDGQIKVYAADSVEGLKDAEPVSEGVTVTERKSAVKTTIEVVLPSTPEKQFFKVKFGE